MFGLGAGELVLILFISLLFIGPKKLPELARGLGRGFREFQRAKNELQDEGEDKNKSLNEDKMTQEDAKS